MEAATRHPTRRNLHNSMQLLINLQLAFQLDVCLYVNILEIFETLFYLYRMRTHGCLNDSKHVLTQNGRIS